MRIHVTVAPNAKLQSITKIDDAHYKIKVDARAIEGKANALLIAMISEYFNVPKSKVGIIGGAHSKRKIISISE